MGLYKRTGSPHYWFRFSYGGHETRASTGTRNREEAEQVEARAKQERFQSDRLGITPARLWESAAADYLDSLAGDNRYNTAGRIVWLGKYLNGVDIAKVSRPLLEKIQQEKAKTCKPGTVNRVLGIVHAILAREARHGRLAAAPSIEMLPDPVKRLDPITREQADVLIKWLPSHQIPMVLFALETGLRRTNITHLRWSQVDLGRRMAWIHPDQAKEKEGIPVPLSDLAVEVLDGQVGRHPDWVFVYRGGPVYQTSTLAWREACAKAGLAGFRWHDLRHVWASWHRQAGTPMDALQDLGGWRDPKSVRRYAYLGADHLAEYVNRRPAARTKDGTVEVETKVGKAGK